MPNPEAMIKAIDKRVTAIERKLDTMEKELRKQGDITALAKRITTLETAFKSLVSTNKGVGSDANTEKELRELTKRLEAREHDIKKVLNSYDPDADKKISNLEKRKDVLEKTITALNARATRDQKAFEENQKAQVAEIQRMSKELNEQSKRMGEAAVVDTRLKALEAIVRSLAK